MQWERRGKGNNEQFKRQWYILKPIHTRFKIHFTDGWLIDHKKQFDKFLGQHTMIKHFINIFGTRERNNKSLRWTNIVKNLMILVKSLHFLEERLMHVKIHVKKIPSYVVGNCDYPKLGQNVKLRNCYMVNLENQSQIFCQSYATMESRSINCYALSRRITSGY